MADTTFVDYTTPAVTAAWLNDINDHVYNGLRKDDISVINVKDPQYGALGDGATNDEAAIALALAEASAEVGTTVYFPPGDYLVAGSDSVIVPDGVNIFMDKGAWLTCAGTTLTNFVSPEGNNILQVNIDGNSLPGGGIQATWDATAGGAIGISSHSSTSVNYNIENVTLVNCEIKNLQYGIFAEGAKNWSVTNCYFHHLRNSGVQMGAKLSRECLRNVISFNRFETCGDYAVTFFSTDSVNKGKNAYNSVVGNVAYNMQQRTNGYAFGVEAGDPAYQHHFVFANNTYWNDTAGTSQGNGGITISTCADSIVSGNSLTGLYATGSIGQEIGINAVAFGSYDAKSCLIENNFIEGFSFAGINVDGHNHVSVLNNYIKNCGFTSSSYPAIMVANSFSTSYSVIKGNTLYITSGYASYGAGTPAIRCNEASTKTVSYITIQDNTIINPNDIGIQLIGTDFAVVTGNTIIGTGDATFFQREPIYLDDCDNFVVTNNNIVNPLRGFVASNCVGGVIAENNIRGTSTISTLYTLTSSTDLFIRNNIVNNTVTTVVAAPTSVITTAGNNNIASGNTKLVTEASGVTSAIATGSTVSHGLSFTPTVVLVTPAESGPTDIYVSSVGASTFTVNFGGGGSKTFYWRATLR